MRHNSEGDAAANGRQTARLRRLSDYLHGNVTRAEVAVGSTNSQGFLAVREDGARVSDLKDRRGMWCFFGIRPNSEAGTVPPSFNLSRRD
jgi:hypothetical protein